MRSAGFASDPAARRFVLHVAIAFLPAALLGLAFEHAIRRACSRRAGPRSIHRWRSGDPVGRRRNHRVRVERVDDMTWVDALKVGFAQAFALIPGTSRSGATIIGGCLFGLSRSAATEFSFFPRCADADCGGRLRLDQAS